MHNALHARKSLLLLLLNIILLILCQTSDKACCRQACMQANLGNGNWLLHLFFVEIISHKACHRAMDNRQGLERVPLCRHSMILRVMRGRHDRRRCNRMSKPTASWRVLSHASNSSCILGDYVPSWAGRILWDSRFIKHVVSFVRGNQVDNTTCCSR